MIKLPAARKVLSTVAVAAVVGATLSPMAASAKGGRHHHGYGAAAIAGGLLLGAIVASSYDNGVVYDRDCWFEKRKRFDAYGDVYFVRVRVCD